MKVVLSELILIILPNRNLLAKFDTIQKLLTNHFELENKNINYVCPIQRQVH